MQNLIFQEKHLRTSNPLIIFRRCVSSAARSSALSRTAVRSRWKTERTWELALLTPKFAEPAAEYSYASANAKSCSWQAETRDALYSRRMLIRWQINVWVVLTSNIMELFNSKRWRLYWPKQKAVVFMLNPKKYASLAWHNSIMFDCLADPVVHLLPLKSSMPQKQQWYFPL